MEFRILGPLEIVDGSPVSIDAPKQRALLGVLLLHPNEVVSADRLTDELWGERPPATAGKLVQTYVSQLRRALGADVIVTRAPGYVLRIDEEALDAVRFRRLTAEARAFAAGGEHERADTLFGEALALWRGAPLADVAFESFARNEVERVEEERLAALMDRIDCELALDRHDEVIPELEGLAKQYPLRERLGAQLMLALYRCGRQSEALDVYQEARRRLAGELGLEPGEQLQQLERAILVHDPALERPRVPPEAVGEPPTRRRLGVAVVLAAALLVAALIAGFLLLQDDDAPVRDGAAPPVLPNSLVKIDARTNTVDDVIAVGRFPGKVAAGFGFVWVVNIEDETLTRVTTSSGRADLVGGLRVDEPTGLAADDPRGVFVGSFATSEVVLIDPSGLQVEDRLGLPGETALFVATGAGSLWITQPPLGFEETAPSAISRVSILHGRMQRRFAVAAGVLPGQIAFGEGAAWVANVGDGTIWRIDAASDRITRIQVGSQPTDVAVDFGSVWVPCLGRDAVWRLDAATGNVEAIIPVGEEALAVAAGAGAVWVTNQADGTVSRIDPRTNKVVRTIRLGFNPHGIAIADGAVWVAVARGLI